MNKETELMGYTSKKNSVRLIVTDVDGTLITKNREMTSQTKETLAELRERNIPVVAASSRPPRGMAFVLEAAGMFARNVPVVSMNGALITETLAASDSAPLWSVMPETSVVEGLYDNLQDLVRSGDVNFMLLDAEEWYSSGDDELVRREAASLRFEPIVGVSRLVRRMQSPVSKVTLLGRPEAITEAKQRINVRFADTVSASSPANPKFLDITAPNVHKGTALLCLAERFGLEVDEICAIGDGENDMEMFRAAGISIAMGHASDVVRSSATYVTASNDHEGWALGVRKVVLGQAVSG